MTATARSVSVIVPCHNAEKTLAACLAAIVRQTHPPDEIIVVDDASTDRSPAIARRFPCTLITLPANRGVAAARNAGLAASRGDVLFFADADIALRSDAVGNALHVLHDVPGCGLVQGVYHPEPLIDDGPVEWCRTLYENYWRSRAAGPITVTLFALTAVRRDVFDRTGGFDERLRDSEDIEFASRLPRDCVVWMTDTVVGRHDDADRLIPLLREQFRRAATFAAVAALGWRRRDARAAFASRTGSLSAPGVLSAALLPATTPLALWSPWLLVLPGSALLGFAAANHGLLRAVRRHRGATFLPTFVGVHLLVNLANLIGAGTGALRLLAAARRTPPTATASPDGTGGGR